MKNLLNIVLVMSFMFVGVTSVYANNWEYGQRKEFKVKDKDLKNIDINSGYYHGRKALNLLKKYKINPKHLCLVVNKAFWQDFGEDSNNYLPYDDIKVCEKERYYTVYYGYYSRNLGGNAPGELISCINTDLDDVRQGDVLALSTEDGEIKKYRSVLECMKYQGEEINELIKDEIKFQKRLAREKNKGK